MKKLLLIIAAITLFSLLSEAQWGNNIKTKINNFRKDTIETEYQHANRYLFGPSAFGLKKGDKYYSTHALLFHDFQYGITDNFSLGAGTSIILNPVYLNAIYTYPINDKSAFALGDLVLAETLMKSYFIGNLFYGSYTRGNLDNNFSAGVGLWTTPESDISEKTISPAFNISAQLKIISNVYAITENYGFKMNTEEGAFHKHKEEDPNNPGYYRTIFDTKYFIQGNSILGGLSGFRYVSRKHPKRSWQLGLIYIIIRHGDAPDKYNNSYWDVPTENSYNFLYIPFISYSTKF